MASRMQPIFKSLVIKLTALNDPEGFKKFLIGKKIYFLFIVFIMIGIIQGSRVLNKKGRKCDIQYIAIEGFKLLQGKNCLAASCRTYNDNRGL